MAQKEKKPLKKILAHLQENSGIIQIKILTLGYPTSFLMSEWHIPATKDPEISFSQFCQNPFKKQLVQQLRLTTSQQAEADPGVP